MMSKYRKEEAVNGQWTRDIRPCIDQPYKMACCDCGLVHDIEFWVDEDDNRPMFRVRRNNRATGQIRRYMK